MDLFALILVTITAITICGICLFIFVCALQPKILRKLHGISADIEDEEAASNLSEENTDRPVETVDDRDGTSGRDKKAFLKDLEKSLRTGRPIRSSEDHQSDEPSPSDPSNYFYRWIRKYISW